MLEFLKNVTLVWTLSACQGSQVSMTLYPCSIGMFPLLIAKMNNFNTNKKKLNIVISVAAVLRGHPNGL